MLQSDNSYFSTNNYAYSNSNHLDPTNCLPPKPFLAKVLDISDHNNSEQPNPDSELLVVDKNDVVAIENREGVEWFIARSDQQIGKLKTSCCQLLDDDIPLPLCQYLINNQLFNLHVCYASFVAQDIGDLSITKGDIIVALNQVNEHWVQGQVCFDSQANKPWPDLDPSLHVGTFPMNHCWLLDPSRVKQFCDIKVKAHQDKQNQQQKAIPPRPPFILNKHSSSLSSGSSSLHSSDNQQSQQHNFKPPPRPEQLPRQAVQQPAVEQFQKPSILTSRQQDKLKGWLQTVKKKTARLSTRITASLGLISLTRDEEFERHHESFKHLEKTIRTFIKNLSTFVEHFENFLIALQNTSENLADFYRDKSHQKELDELRRKNKALACEHFHAFKRSVDRQVIAVASQLLQKFANPHQLISKRSAKLLDYDNKTKEMDCCRDLEKKAALRDQYVIAKDIYDRINRQLIQELPLFNQFALDIFKECILVLLENRRNLIFSYTKLTASLLDTPLMMTYTASDVASSILMSCELAQTFQDKQNADIDRLLEQDRKDSGHTSGHDTRHNSANDDEMSRPHSVASQLSSEFDQMALAAREISSTPLPQVNEPQTEGVVRFDDVDGRLNVSSGWDTNRKNQSFIDETNSADDGTEPVRKNPSQKERRKKKKFQIYVASWPFVATGPNQLTIVCKQPLKLIKASDECGNPDWSLVQDKKGQLGYVPSTYIKKKE